MTSSQAYSVNRDVNMEDFIYLNVCMCTTGIALMLHTYMESEDKVVELVYFVHLYVRSKDVTQVASLV